MVSRSTPVRGGGSTSRSPGRSPSFGYWFAWSSVLAVYGSFIGLLLIGEFADADSRHRRPTRGIRAGSSAFSWAKLIGIGAILALLLFNVRGMRPAVGSQLRRRRDDDHPRRRDRDRPAPHGRRLEPRASTRTTSPASVEFFGDSPSGFNQFALIMVWLYILGWSTYGPEAAATFAPEYKDTKNDTRKALAVTGGMYVVLAVPAAGRRARHGRLRRDRRRPVGCRLPDRRDARDRRRHDSARFSRSACAPGCCSR